MKFAKKIIVLLFILTLTLCIVSCSSSQKIIGTWKSSTGILGQEIETVYTFNKDGTGTVSTVLGISTDFTYTVEGDVLKITTSILGINNTETHNISFGNNKMFFSSDGIAIEFTKQ